MAPHGVDADGMPVDPDVKRAADAAQARTRMWQHAQLHCLDLCAFLLEQGGKVRHTGMPWLAAGCMMVCV